MSRQQAIKAKCIDCIYDPLDKGTNLAQIENCTMLDCPLHPYRPIPKASKPKGAFRTKAQMEHMANMRAAKEIL